MNADHIELLRRLEQFQLDLPDVSFPFSRKLARENGWSADYTQRAIAEYKRFAFLACAAGHPVSPSEDVDQVWHLHLTYTESYWTVFCPQVLQRRLHHQPTRGGATESEKFDHWYARTLASYAEFFGENPPADIWPDPDSRRRAKHEFVRVDRCRHWVIPRPRVPVNSKFSGAVALAGVVICCSGAMLAQTANVFDWGGPDFLRFYVVLQFACVVFALWLRRLLRLPGNSADSAADSGLDGYSIAYLNGGRVLAVGTAVASLAARDAMKVIKNTRRLRSKEPKPDFTHPLEEGVYVTALGPTGSTIGELRDSVARTTDRIAQNLQHRGLVVDANTAWKVVWVPLCVALSPAAVGVIKTLIGLSRGKPVLYLLGLCILSVIVSLLVFLRRPRRTRKGDALLDLLRRRHAGRRFLPSVSQSAPAADLPVLIGLFGMNALAGADFSPLRAALNPPVDRDGFWNRVGGSGCGNCGSGCGVGGSCGGGGDGGGGGGGCGGCSGH
jgi:uncharacterized protein (TIGR04222 family)